MKTWLECIATRGASRSESSPRRGCRRQFYGGRDTMTTFRFTIHHISCLLAFPMVVAIAANPATGTALDDYVAAPDANYEYFVANVIPGPAEALGRLWDEFRFADWGGCGFSHVVHPPLFPPPGPKPPKPGSIASHTSIAAWKSGSSWSMSPNGPPPPGPPPPGPIAVKSGSSM